MDSFDNTKIRSLACKALVDKNQNMHEVNSQLLWLFDIIQFLMVCYYLKFDVVINRDLYQYLHVYVAKLWIKDINCNMTQVESDSWNHDRSNYILPRSALSAVWFIPAVLMLQSTLCSSVFTVTHVDIFSPCLKNTCHRSSEHSAPAFYSILVS